MLGTKGKSIVSHAKKEYKAFSKLSWQDSASLPQKLY